MTAIPVTPPARCPKCKTALTLLEWSESARENETTCLWRCTFCGHEFETKSNVVEKEPPGAELAEEFLPDLVVE